MAEKPHLLAEQDQAHAYFGDLLSEFVADVRGELARDPDTTGLAVDIATAMAVSGLLDPERHNKMYVMLAVAIVRLAQQPEVTR